MTALFRSTCPPGAARRAVVLLAVLLVTLAGAPALAEQSTEARVEVAYERGARALRQGDPAAAAGFLAEAAELAPEDPQVLLLYGQALVELERNAEAAEILERLERIDPEAPGGSLLLGVALLRLGRLEEAQERLERAVDREPGDSRARLFLGITYQDLGLAVEARRELEEAARLDPGLAGPVAYRLGLLALQQREEELARGFFEETLIREPDSPLARAARDYLQRIGAEERRRYRLYATTGLVWDSNLNLAGDRIALTARRLHDWRVLAEVGGRYELVRRPELRLGIGQVLFLSVNKDEHAFDISYGRSYLDASYRIFENLALDLYAHAQWSFADWRFFHRGYRVEPALRFSPVEGYVTRLYAGWEDRDFDFGGDFRQELDRDGQLRTAGVDQYLPLPGLFGSEAGFVRIGYRRRVESTDGDNFDAHGNALLASLGAPLPAAFYLFLDGYYERRRHAKPSILQPAVGRRDDHIRVGRIALRRAFGARWSAEAAWRRINWSSNAGDFDYHRSLVSFLVTYRY